MQERYDVVVVGGGPGGLAAAIASGRMGAKTLLVERYGFLGGMSTAALVYPWMSFHDMTGRQVVAGIAQEIVDRLMALGGSPGHQPDTIGVSHSVTPFDKELLKDLAVTMVTEAGVDLLLHSTVTAADSDGRAITALGTASPYGSRTIRGRYYVDGTGDCGLVHLAGGATVKGRPADGRVQPMTMMLRFGGVDFGPIRRYMQAHPEDFWPTTLFDQLDRQPLTGVSGFFSIWKQYGPSYIPRNTVLLFAGIRPGEAVLNTGRIIELDPTSVESMTRAEVEARRQTSDLAAFMRQHVPGFEQSYLLESGVQVGIRESRRLAGLYTLSTDDATAGRSFDDTIALNGYQIDIHDPAGKELVNLPLAHEVFGIPYRSLVPRDLANVVVAGRAISCSVEAFAALRITPVCMAIGQAAGTAAALASREGDAMRDVDCQALRARLREAGAVLE